VVNDAFTDATLVLLGHGATQNAESAAPVFQHAAELRRRRLFAAVREAFWKQEPHIKAVLPEISTPRIFIVPLFISEGYFASDVIPHELGFASVPSAIFHPPSLIFYCAPIGTHDRMTDVLLARARNIVAQFPFPQAPKPADITLLLAGHGTERDANSRRAIERQVERIRGQNLYAAVHAIFLEEAPRIADCYALAATRHLVIVPFFISDGLHTQEDIPIMLGEPEHAVRERLQAAQPTWRNPTEKNGKLVWVSPAVGSAPEIDDLILERVREAAKNL